MLHDEIAEFEKISGRDANDASVGYIGGYLDGYQKFLQSVNSSETCINNNQDYGECDQFICSECNIELQGWDKVERKGRKKVYYEYAFNFCPNCGKKIIKDSTLN